MYSSIYAAMPLYAGRFEMANHGLQVIPGEREECKIKRIGVG